MRTVVVLALLALTVASGVVARPHRRHHDTEIEGMKPATAAEVANAVQPGRAWLLDAAVLPQEGEELDFGLHAESNTSSADWVLYKQCGESWSNDELGSAAGVTICDAGCAMTSVAMALKTRGAGVNPGSLNSWLRGHGGYVGGDNLVWASVNAFGKMAMYNYYRGYGSFSQSNLQGVIAKGWPVVVNVRGGTHWVLVTGYAGGSTFRVNDPGFPSTTYTYGEMGNFVVYH